MYRIFIILGALHSLHYIHYIICNSQVLQWFKHRVIDPLTKLERFGLCLFF